MLKDDGATWTDSLAHRFQFADRWESEQFSSLKEWYNSFNGLSNWNRLNAVLVLASNLETFIATIVRLAIDSDPGVLFGATRSIDGVSLLKYRSAGSIDIEKIVESMVRGDWQSRHKSYVRVFGNSPYVFSSAISELDKIRILRDDIAHSFGRNIAESRRHGQISTLQITSVSTKRLSNIQEVTRNVARSIDAHLQYFHIGAYQAIAFYHELLPDLRKDVHPSIRAAELKKL